jgi:hypothetical protein
VPERICIKAVCIYDENLSTCKNTIESFAELEFSITIKFVPPHPIIQNCVNQKTLELCRLVRTLNQYCIYVESCKDADLFTIHCED